MNNSINKELIWIDGQQHAMLGMLQEWAAINSGSYNLAGLSEMLKTIKAHLQPLADTVTEIELPPNITIDDQGSKIQMPLGKALHAIKRPSAPIQIFLGGHMDTVYSPHHPSQTTKLVEVENRLYGPGVADMKGGLIVMLKALEAFESSPLAKNIGWEVVINPDEEIGSCGSEELLIQCAKRCHYALIFEPAFPDGSIVDSRKGSYNFVVTAHGIEAHAGRDFHLGQNAIATLAKFIVEAEKLNDPAQGITVNFGKITGGGPVNIVPKIASCHINARATTLEGFESLYSNFSSLVKTAVPASPLDLHILSSRPPKTFDTKSQALFKLLKDCAGEEKIPLHHHPSGGVCDGNIFAAQGVPVIDTLGVVGGAIHTSDEYMLIDSFVSRTRLATRLLTALAVYNPRNGSSTR